ncbi:hypothetical protein [Anatilimnocola floriformis]|uniref:hypothetical protein n=1 Tax=Anatilimnocola floriformis TaxID=2948575 RepID=UPI0020C509D7|nr:hypothetical protein [Anatilimnocola floriformis]
MRDEVEEFLRRAAARRAQAEAKRREQQQPAKPAPPPQQPQRQPLVQRQPLAQRAPVQAEPLVEIIDAEVADTSSSFNSSVSQHLRGTTEIARHASSLGAEVDQADDRLEARLHKTFDHQLGQLKDTTTAAPVKQPMQTSDALLASMNLTRLLSNAQSIRNAIILSEVLNRPESRWE